MADVRQEATRHSGVVEERRPPLFTPGDLQFIAAWMLTAPLRLLPAASRISLLRQLSRILGALWYRSGVGDVRRVRRNLQTLFPGRWQPADLDAQVRDMLRLAAWNSMMVDVLPALRDEHAANLLQVEGTEHLDSARGPVLLLGAHYGPFAYAITAVLRARDYPILEVGRHARPKPNGSLLYQKLYWPRIVGVLEHLQVIDLESSSQDVLLNKLQNGEIVYLLLDDYTIPQPGEPLPSGVVPVRFLGRTVYLQTNDLYLAKRQQAQIVTALPLPEGDGRSIALAPMAYATTGFELADLAQDLAAYMARVEERVRTHPCLWRDLRRHDLFERLRLEEEPVA